jgi:hypothetical protein
MNQSDEVVRGAMVAHNGTLMWPPPAPKVVVPPPSTAAAASTAEPEEVRYYGPGPLIGAIGGPEEGGDEDGGGIGVDARHNVVDGNGIADSSIHSNVHHIRTRRNRRISYCMGRETGVA